MASEHRAPDDSITMYGPDDGLLGITKVTHNGRDKNRRSATIRAPVNVAEELGADPGDRIAWIRGDDGEVAFFKIDQDEWREFLEDGDD